MKENTDHTQQLPRGFANQAKTRWATLPRWLKRIAMACAVLAVVAFAGMIIIVGKYSRKAASFEIGALEEIGKGSEVLDRNRVEIGRIFIEDRKILAYHEFPQILSDAVIATEDSRFFSHGGVDYRGMARSAVENILSGSIKQGASTITQQLTRHVYRLKGRNFDRKLTEIFMAGRLEKEYSKAEILTYYLNNIYMGSGSYGMGSAAEGYFGKEVADLELHEAALLAGIIKSPSGYSPFVSPEKAKTVRNLTLGRMRDLKMISREEHASAVAKDLGILPIEMRETSPFFALQAVRREINDRNGGRRNLDNGSVYTTLDNTLIDASIAALQVQLHRFEDSHPQPEKGKSGEKPRLEGAAVVIENRTGRILSAVGGRDYRKNAFDYAFKGARTPGTAFLPLTYAAYFSADPERLRGYLLDGPIDNEKVMIGGTKGMLGEWGTLASGFGGEVPAALAFLQAKTGAAVRAGYDTGIDSLIKTARSLGVESEIRDYPASYLGVSKVRLIELARAYTAFANGSAVCPEPRLVEGVLNSNGTRAKLAEPVNIATVTPIDRDVATFIRSLMASRLRTADFDSVLNGYGVGNSGLAGQHGSSHGSVDGWFVGFDRNITCAVWVGYIDGTPLGVVNPGYNLAFPIWAEIMAGATSGKPSGFGGKTPGGKSVCLGSGGLATARCERAPDNGTVPVSEFPVSMRPTTECTLHAEGGEKVAAPARAQVVEPNSEYGAQLIKAASEFLPGGDPYSAKKP